ncbi:alpha/beta hydrolase [Luteibacter rhizovicinus DSM 16549]|jgi:predicted alpha/beta-fold hydrolase|uniref:Alpha/beta hydrolase n=1 Tax=Luteibacter rhizovicinus DSM 16549 TaxID=1440763 RepID=A0A0G9HH50_9GAMM|nr:alpha/beta fold hydrolase [Luteibacter rhizovicinus]APG03631.1 alpha/beta hydrolase [Luteibacter rhizovicinus DSM 16549]KLD68796.1 alpha/beta hydrolase [Luteibacter rhizovicinus DSM 16549]
MSLPKGSDFLPPWPLRSGHIQTMLSSSGVRRRLLPKRAHQVQVDAREVLVDVGQGDRLSGRYTAQATGRESRGLAILFHGWEGSVDSTYVLQTGSRLLEDGWDVFRLNFRDHGDSHGLNEALFHSCRIDEVVTALGEIARMFPAKTIGVAGFSLGGNFALRAAMLAPSQGVPLDYVLAVCPIVDPAEGLFSLEKEAPWIYHAYFMQKWRRSLRLKQEAFPQQTYFELNELKQNMRELTASLVLRHTDFGSLEAYLDGYSIAGDRLMNMHVPATILTSSDDPVIPIGAFHALRLPPNIELDIASYGGHCGFIRDFSMTSFTDDYIAARFNAIAR